MDNPLKKEFAQKVKVAVVDALQHIQTALDTGKYIGTIFDWGNVQYQENGMPSFISSLDGPTDYIGAFHPETRQSESPHDPTKEIQSFGELQEFIFKNEFLNRRILSPGTWEARDSIEDDLDFVRFTTCYIPQKIADRYVHLYDTTDFDQILYQELYNEYEQSVFAERLGLEIHIPILFLNFSFPEIRIDEQARIVEMDDDFHRARYSAKTHGPRGHDFVLPCATHSLVLDNWSIENKNQFDLDQVLSNQEAFPIDHVDKFFGALRAICGQPTGYCQLLCRPVGWSQPWYWKGALPQVRGTSVRAYPGFFDNFYWNRDSYPLLNVDDILRCGIAFRQLLNAEENSITIGVRRLNRCYCRDDEDDWIIDATIALEALLSDDAPQEMTHKLALRVAAVSQLVPGQSKSADQVFKDIKAVYKLRSQIVHGRVPKEKDRVIAVSEQEHVSTSEIAREHLRNVLRVLIDYPEYRTASNVDKLLFDRISSVRMDDKTAD